MIDMFLQIFIFIEMVFWQLFYLLLAMPFTLILLFGWLYLFADDVDKNYLHTCLLRYGLEDD